MKDIFRTVRDVKRWHDTIVEFEDRGADMSHKCFYRPYPRVTGPPRRKIPRRT